MQSGSKTCDCSDHAKYKEQPVNEITGDGNNADLVATLKSLTTGTQDIATLIDLLFAVPEVVIGTIGVISVGPEAIPVTVGGVDILFNVYLGNEAETFFSFLSLGFTVASDYLDDNQFGDATMTSAVTFVAGAGMLDPVGDLAIDGYASGYKHGIFNGFMDIMNGLPFFKNWP